MHMYWFLGTPPQASHIVPLSSVQWEIAASPFGRFDSTSRGSRANLPEFYRARSRALNVRFFDGYDDNFAGEIIVSGYNSTRVHLLGRSFSAINVIQLVTRRTARGSTPSQPTYLLRRKNPPPQ